jgi:MFS family permease
MADIGGGNSIAWLGMANTLATAAMTPFAGAIADLIGRRSVGLIGLMFVMVGAVVVGLCTRIDVAIGGSALIGVGAGLCEMVGAAGIAELAPVKSRGTYIGTCCLLLLPMGGCAAYGMRWVEFINKWHNFTLQHLHGGGEHGFL